MVCLASHSLILDGCRIDKMLRVKIVDDKIIGIDYFEKELENTIFVNKEIVLNSLDGCLWNESFTKSDSFIEKLNEFVALKSFDIKYRI